MEIVIIYVLGLLLSFGVTIPYFASKGIHPGKLPLLLIFIPGINIFYAAYLLMIHWSDFKDLYGINDLNKYK